MVRMHGVRWLISHPSPNNIGLRLVFLEERIERPYLKKFYDCSVKRMFPQSTNLMFLKNFLSKLKQYILRSKINPIKLYNNIERSYSIELCWLITKVWILSSYKFWFKLNCTKNKSPCGSLAAVSKHSPTELNFQQKKK